MKFYGVTTKFYDNGRIKSFMYDIEAERKPESTFKETKICDVYNDFFLKLMKKQKNLLMMHIEHEINKKELKNE